MKFLYRQSMLILCSLFILSFANAQDSIPACIRQKANTMAEAHSKNPCQGSDKLKYIDCYSYRDTILYQLVFENKNPCPDFIAHTLYFDSLCRVRIEVIDGGLKYRHQVIPAGTDLSLLRFISHIKAKFSLPRVKKQNLKY
jgi:hypothetical protein